MALLEISKALKGIAGKSCIGAAEANGDQQAPARIGQGALAGPDEKQSQQKAAGHIDEQGSVGKIGRDDSGGKAADGVTGGGAHNCAQRHPQICVHGGLLLVVVGVISPQGRLRRTPSPCFDSSEESAAAKDAVTSNSC